MSGNCRYWFLEILYYPRNRRFSTTKYPIGSVSVGYDMSHIPVPGTYLFSGEYAVLEEGRLRACHARFENMSFLTFSMVGRASGTNNCFSPDSHEIGTRMPTTCPGHEHLQLCFYIFVFLGDELVRFRSGYVRICVKVTLSFIFELKL